MAFILDDKNVMILRGKTREGLSRETRCWAERGRIHVEDSSDNSYQSMSIRSFLRRLNALNETLGNSDPSGDHGSDADLRDEIQRQVEKGMELAARAKAQGSPDCARARRYLKDQRPKTVYVGGPGKHVL